LGIFELVEGGLLLSFQAFGLTIECTASICITLALATHGGCMVAIRLQAALECCLHPHGPCRNDTLSTGNEQDRLVASRTWLFRSILCFVYEVHSSHRSFFNIITWCFYFKSVLTDVW